MGGQRLALRSWKDTETGPRAVNESAMVLQAALDRIVACGITHVVLAGDYTDDGQAENTRRLARFLQGNQGRYGLRFYAIPGNHDLFGSHGKHVSTRFVTAPGRTVHVTSDPEQAGQGIVTPAMRSEGQPGALLPMAEFGLFRQPWHLHWESPFGAEDAPEARMFTAVAPDASVSHRLMDASYLVEPEAGLWLLMLDANVFEPRAGRHDPSRKKAFGDPSDAGWGAVLRLKPFLLPWIAGVTERARVLGKTLVTVSHYPVLDPFRDDAGSERALFGETGFARRTPPPEVGRALAAAGLRFHAGGHLHVAATTRRAGPEGTLVDLSLPSLVSFPSGFRILHASPERIHVQSVSLDDLAPDPGLARLYASEGRKAPPLPLGAFLTAQFRARCLARRLPTEWPPHLVAWIGGRTVLDLVGLLARPDGVADHAAILQAYPLPDMITDAYLLREGGSAALDRINPAHLHVCRTLARNFGDANSDPAASDAAFFRRFLSVLQISLQRAEDVEDAADPFAFPRGFSLFPQG